MNWYAFKWLDHTKYAITQAVFKLKCLWEVYQNVPEWYMNIYYIFFSDNEVFCKVDIVEHLDTIKVHGKNRSEQVEIYEPSDLSAIWPPLILIETP